MLLFISYTEDEKNLHATLNSQRIIINLVIDEPIKYSTLTINCELLEWTDAMDEDWSP